MPKLSTPEAKERFEAKILRRIDFVARHFIAVCPVASAKGKEIISKRKLAPLVSTHAAENGLATEPWFMGSKRRVESMFLNQWKRVRDYSRDELGSMTDYSCHDGRGVKRAGIRGAGHVNAFDGSVSAGVAKHQNEEAKAHKLLLGVESYCIQLKLLKA